MKNLHIFREGRSSVSSGSDEEVRARTVMGMDVTPESLPQDIVSAAQRAWADGDKQLALSLLYRGSLEWMVNSAKLPILESDTEHDCVNYAQQMGNSSISNYFSKLTNLWVSLAYGKNEPEDSSIDWLCGDWPFNQRMQLDTKEGEV